MNRICLRSFFQNTSLCASKKFLFQLFLIICSLIFLQSKGIKRKSLYRKSTKLSQYFFSIATVSKKKRTFTASKREPWICKICCLKVLFPDIEKITNPSKRKQARMVKRKGGRSVSTLHIQVMKFVKDFFVFREK